MTDCFGRRVKWRCYPVITVYQRWTIGTRIRMPRALQQTQDLWKDQGMCFPRA